jgi:hypothetical protein
MGRARRSISAFTDQQRAERAWHCSASRVGHFWECAMLDYKLILLQSAEGPIETIEFQSSSPAEALALAYRHYGQSAELWQGSEPLCRLKYAKAGYWIVEPAKESVSTPTG